MPGFSEAYETAVLQATFKGQALAALTGLFVSLHSADPGDSGVSELAGGAYARVAVPPDGSPAAGNWTVVDQGGPQAQSRVRNNVAVLFPRATANWLQASYFGVWTTATGTAAADFIGSGPIDGGGLAITTGNRIEFAPQELEFWLE